MGPFDQLILFLDEQGGRNKLDSLQFHVKIKRGPGETKAFVLRAQEAGLVNYIDSGVGGRQAVSLTGEGRKRVAQIKAGQPPVDRRADPSYYAGAGPLASLNAWKYQMELYGRLGGPEPLSVSLFKKPKKGKRKTSNVPRPAPSIQPVASTSSNAGAAEDTSSADEAVAGTSGAEDDVSSLTLGADALTLVPRRVVPRASEQSALDSAPAS